MKRKLIAEDLTDVGRTGNR